MKYIIVDRDGTLIRYIPYLHDPCQVELLPTVVEGLIKFLDLGYKLFLHTNQSGVSRGYFSQVDVLACNNELLRQIGLGENLFEEICISPEMPGQTVLYRKPSPNYGIKIIKKYNIDKSKICYIGDNITDLLTAKNIGCMGVGVNTGVEGLYEKLQENNITKHFSIFDNFLEAVNYIINNK